MWALIKKDWIMGKYMHALSIIGVCDELQEYALWLHAKTNRNDKEPSRTNLCHFRNRGNTPKQTLEYEYHLLEREIGTSMEYEALCAEMVRQLDTLLEREKDVLMSRFGMGDSDAHTLQQIADRYRLSHERIRQVEAKALRKLRRPACATPLRPFLERRS